jgi:hypothetical protein
MIKVPSKHQPISKRGQELYEHNLRSQVETEENIGKIIVIDVETGNYAIDANGLEASRRLRADHPDVKPESLFAIRIGYNSVFAVGGAVTRTTE